VGGSNMAQQSYVVAVKSGVKVDAPADWFEQMKHIQGLTVVSKLYGDSRGIYRVVGSESALNELRQRMGDYLVITPEVIGQLPKPGPDLDL
jgi:hypothetical protein